MFTYGHLPLALYANYASAYALLATCWEIYIEGITKCHHKALPITWMSRYEVFQMFLLWKEPKIVSIHECRRYFQELRSTVFNNLNIIQ